MSLIPNGLAKSAAEAGFYTHPINQSLRLNDDDSAYLSWTPASAGNRKTWTWSGWVKRGSLTAGFYLLSGGDNYNATGTSITIQYDSGANIRVRKYINGTGTDVKTTNAAYRDTGAWYHIVCAMDSTDATASDRLKLWVNGERVTSFKTENNLSLNEESGVNNSKPHEIGKLVGYTSNQLDGYLAEVHFIDGTALDASSFGETKSGVWIPKAYSGSYGTNGFYLDFDGTYYNDKSGNGNNFTANNLAATDVVLDSPTNNFCTWNPLFKASTSVIAWINNAVTFLEGNLRANLNTGNETQSGAVGTFTVPTSGKYYWEILAIAEASGSISGTGVIEPSTGNYVRTASNTSGRTYAAGDIINVAFDADNSRIYFGVNGTFATDQTPTDPSDGTSATGSDYLPYVWGNHAGSPNQFTANFGQDSSFAGNKTAQGNTDANGYGDFYYAPPTGYLALCTANLEVPDAMNPALDASPQDYFNTVLHSGNSSTQAITGVGFQPDWVWSKERNIARSHNIFDAVRGTLKTLSSDTTGAENNLTNSLTSFDSDGFTLGSDGAVNYTGRTYVNWCWKANGSGVSNTDGSITSTVSANTDAGFSIVSWASDGTDGKSVGHGLTEKPDMIIVKNRSQALDWHVWHSGLGSTGEEFIYLNKTDNYYDYNYAYLASNTSTFSPQGNTKVRGSSGDNMLAYCFHSVSGFSKFGSMTMNGSSDGVFVYTGFRPAFVMAKRTDSTGSWFMLDDARDTYNVADNQLFANVSDAESSGTGVWDFLSNGFKARYAFTSGATYIFMAFSSNPFKFSTAR